MESVCPGQGRPGRARISREAQALGPTMEGPRCTRSAGKGQEERVAAGRTMRSNRSASLSRVEAAVLEDWARPHTAVRKTQQREVPGGSGSECGGGAVTEGKSVHQSKVKQLNSEDEFKKPDMKKSLRPVESSKCAISVAAATVLPVNNVVLSELSTGAPGSPASVRGFSGGSLPVRGEAPQDRQSVPVSSSVMSLPGAGVSPAVCAAPSGAETISVSVGAADVLGNAGSEQENAKQNFCGSHVGALSIGAVSLHVASSHFDSQGAPLYEGLHSESLASGHLAAPLCEGLHSESLASGHLAAPSKAGSLQAEEVGASCHLATPIKGDAAIDTTELVQLIKTADELEMRRKKLRVDLKNACDNYTMASVQHQDYYQSQVREISSELKTLEKQISTIQKQMGPLSEVHSNRRRFEESQRALKGPVHYRSKHHISSSSSDSDDELKKSGKLSSKKTVVAQIHAPNFVFSADEIHEVDSKVKGHAKPIFREEETFVFSQEEFPSLPSTLQEENPQAPPQQPARQQDVSVEKAGSPAPVQGASLAIGQEHGELSEMELTACHQNSVSGQVGESVEGEAAPMESEGMGEKVAMKCVAVVLNESSSECGQQEGTSLRDNNVTVFSAHPSPSKLSSSSKIVPPTSNTVPSPVPPGTVSTSAAPAVTVQSHESVPGQSSSTPAAKPTSHPSSANVSNAPPPPRVRDAPPPPSNAWNRPTSRIRVPGVKNNIMGPVFKRKNLIRLRWLKEKDSMPTRDELATEMLLKQSTLAPTGVRAFIKFSDNEYDIVFKTFQAMEFFWRDYDGFRHTGLWNDFRVIPITKPETKKVTILFKNDCVPPEDILIWLKRQCKVLTPLQKDMDKYGYWTGG
uniref:Uncharacterized protein n=1 Tax=Xenopus tropicalis TaxID=8364 RepID=A0A803JUC2_XENTR